MCVHVGEGEGAPGLQAQFLWSNRGDDMKPRPEDIPLTASAHGKSHLLTTAPDQSAHLLNCFNEIPNDFSNKTFSLFLYHKNIAHDEENFI